MAASPPKCYYCDEGDFGSVDGYERHVDVDIQIFPVILAPADIELYKLKKQEMSWERAIKSDIALKWLFTMLIHSKAKAENREQQTYRFYHRI